MAITQWQVSLTDITTNGVQAEADIPTKLPSAMKTVFDRLPSFIVTKYNSLITELNTWWTSILSKIVTNGDGLSMLSNDATYRKAIPYTGFTNNANINVSYNSTNRTITLTGSFEAFYQGKIVPDLTSGWVSSAHATDAGTYYLYYNGSGFSFTTTPWSFTDLMIAYVQKNTHNIGVREVHGIMEAECHQYNHTHFGTMKYAGGSFSGYTINSTTATNRRPDISSTVVDDEDLQSTLPALTSKLYTQRYLSGSGATRSFNLDQTEIIPVSGNIPYYNEYSGVTWQQTPFPTNAYGAIFVVAIPTTSDAESQKYRYLFVQPQTVSTNKADIDALTPANLVHGDSANLVSEYTFIGKIIIRYASNNWTIVETISELSGNKIQQIGSRNILPAASAIVFTPTGDLTSVNVQDAIVEVAGSVGGGAYVVYNEATTSYGIGDYAILTNTGQGCTAYGNQALEGNLGNACNGVGDGVLLGNEANYVNGFGNEACKYNTGQYSNGFGYTALRNNTGLSSNGFGYSALSSNIGDHSNGFGDTALDNNEGEYVNVMGTNAGAYNTGDNNNGLGYKTLYLTSGSNNTAIGHNANSNSNAHENTTCLGANTTPNKSNQVVLGDVSVDTIKMGGTTRTPASATATGVKGEVCWDASYIYVCVDTNTWKRVAISTW